MGSARHGRSSALTTSIAVAAAWLVCVMPAQAEGLGGLVRQGMNKVGEGAQAVGRGVSNVGKSVDDSIRDTERAMTNGDDPVAKRAELDAMATNALQRLFEEQPQAVDLFVLSAGYAVFDTRRLAVAGVAAGGGKGVAVSGDRRIYMNMGTAGVSVSFGMGGFATQQVIFFETPWDFENFLADGFDARAEAGAMVGKDAGSLGLNFVNGRATFALTGQGWKVSATATGTKYWPDRVLNAPGP